MPVPETKRDDKPVDSRPVNVHLPQQQPQQPSPPPQPQPQPQPQQFMPPPPPQPAAIGIDQVCYSCTFF